MLTIEERVINGFDALTDHYGPEWQDAIDTETLNLESTCNCVLGQLEGDYWQVFENMAWGDQWTTEQEFLHWSYENGFVSSAVIEMELGRPVDYDYSHEEYKALTQAWRNKLG